MHRTKALNIGNTRRIQILLVAMLTLLVIGCRDGVSGTVTEPDDGSAFIGTYFLNAGVNDPYGPPVYVLEFSGDSSASLTTYPTNTEEPISILAGSWEESDDQAKALFDKEDGSNLEDPVRVIFEFRDLFLVAVDHPYGDEQFEFTIGSGDEHSAVRLLHERLAMVDWLEFEDPGPAGTLYDPETRRAVMAFQASQGLSPSGVVDQQTWDALTDPETPRETEASLFRRFGITTNDLADDSSAKESTAGKVARVQDPTAGSIIDDRPTHIDGQPVVYLTFDDGPTSYTPLFVELLNRYNARGTFFALGSQVDYSPESTGQAAAAGHYQANHTYSHPNLTYLGQNQFNTEIQTAHDAIQRATGGQDQDRGRPLCLRPPYGAVNYNTESYAAALGYELALWDIDPQDWRQPGASQIANQIIAYSYPGAIILLHDGGGYRDQTLAALEIVLQSLSEQGYRFESLCR
jgi:peptidoglycan/xylan/chitin deacetylase (PgdA/CDA1 family)